MQFQKQFHKRVAQKPVGDNSETLFTSSDTTNMQTGMEILLLCPVIRAWDKNSKNGELNMDFFENPQKHCSQSTADPAHTLSREKVESMDFDWESGVLSYGITSDSAAIR